MEIGSYDPHDDMVTMPDGTILPRKLAQRGEAGWDGEQDRDSGEAAKLAGYVRHLDDLVKGWARFDEAYPDQSVFVDLINDLTGTWIEIRKITQGRDITEDGQP